MVEVSRFRIPPALIALVVSVALFGAFLLVSGAFGAQWPVALLMCVAAAVPGGRIWPGRAWGWGVLVSSTFFVFLAIASVALALNGEFSWVAPALALGFPACAILSASVASRFLREATEASG